ncbi:MAG: magnesium/cobalt transporter CorA [Candidatus Omnitrophica bacterium]|nr:magnesium/cobalt transporter CorA [Candidatus Omnitrophota bacterium]
MKLKIIGKKIKEIGLPPGTLVASGDGRTESVRITVIDYDEKNVQEKSIVNVEECFPFREKQSVTWINVDGVHDTGLIERIGSTYGIHSLSLEDIVNTSQRPKCEDYDTYLFIVLKMLTYDEAEKCTHIEQVSLLLGTNFVISFQEKEGDVFNAVRERIRNAKGRIRKMKADYLAYSLIDAIVDHYFLVLEKIGERVEVLEEALISDPKSETQHAIHTLKRETLLLRKSIWPLREVISILLRGESSLIHKSTGVYMRDVYDHTIQIIDTIETLRDMASGMLDLYLSNLSNKMNEVMKVLTIIATIFIPITFVAGVYGMNFEHMPELTWPWGYAGVWGIFISVVLVMIVYFKQKKWL